MNPPFRPLTPAKAKRFCRWACNLLGLGGWRVDVVIGGEPPVADQRNAVAQVQANRPYRIAQVWVNNERCKASGFSPLGSLGHECVHLALEDAGLTADDPKQPEFFCNRMGDFLALAFEKGLRLSDYNPRYFFKKS